MSGNPLSPLQIHQYVLDRADRQVAAQAGAIGARMMWLVLAQSFLFSGFVAGGNIQPPGFGLAVEAIVTSVGFFTCLWVRAGVNAALAAMSRAKLARQVHIDYLEKELNAYLPAVQLEDCEHRLGNMPAERIPTLLLSAWIALFGLLCWRAVYFLLPLVHTPR